MDASAKTQQSNIAAFDSVMVVLPCHRCRQLYKTGRLGHAYAHRTLFPTPQGPTWVALWGVGESVGWPFVGLKYNLVHEIASIEPYLLHR